MKFISNGQAIEYTGGRTTADIVSWVTKRSGSATKELKTTADFDQFVKENKVVAVIFSSDVSVFSNVAIQFDGVEFGHVTSDEVTQHAKGTANTISIFKQFDDLRADFSGDVTNVQAIVDFVNQNAFATVMEFNDQAIERIFQ